MESLYLKLYNKKIKIDSLENQEILNLLGKDFSHFLSNEKNPTTHFSLEIFTQPPPFEKIPKKQSSMQTYNSICYDHEDFRYCDYYGDALVIFNKKTNHAQLYSTNISKIHEISYLLILSRVGKILDLEGKHKLHAFSVSFEDLAIVCMMPMKGGKSTLLMEFLKDPRFKVISDDIPLVNFDGHIMPFPLKIGLSGFPEWLKVVDPENNFYTMDRGQYGKKNLLSLKGIPERVEESERVFKRIVLIEAFRYNSEESFLLDSSFHTSAKGVLKHGIIGFGLPMVMEYFWEEGWRDFLTRTKIFIFRSYAFMRLLFRAKKMKLYLGKRPDEACKVITQYILDNHANLKR